MVILAFAKKLWNVTPANSVGNLYSKKEFKERPGKNCWPSLAPSHLLLKGTFESPKIHEVWILCKDYCNSWSCSRSKLKEKHLQLIIQNYPKTIMEK
jgi:hypothetical protein